ncbi:hypothetical protein J2S16_003087 [Cytobacillus kochii]|nr:hypothetical protein [Cytobacillus kochii]
MIVRMIMISMFSITATTLLFFQGLEIFQAFFDYYKNK